MLGDKNSRFSVGVSGEMSKEDAGKVAKMQAARDLINASGWALVKIAIAFSGTWKGSEVLIELIKAG